MHMHFKTQLKDPSVEMGGILGILNDQIKWSIGKPQPKPPESKDFAHFINATNVVVHWTMRFVAKGSAGFDITISLDHIEGEQVFEFIEYDRDDLHVPFKITQYKDKGWTFNELQFYTEDKEHPQGEFYAQGAEIDFTEKVVDVYFG